MPDVHVNGIRLYRECSGEGDPILTIHGTSSSALVWRDSIGKLAVLGRCIAYDRRGCYHSERPDPYETTDVGTHADDASTLLEVLEATPAIVIGRSYGGEIAIDLALRYPDSVRALVLLEPALLTDPDVQKWAQPLVDSTLEIATREPSRTAEVFLRQVAGDEAWETFPPGFKAMFVGNGPAIVAELTGGFLQVTSEDLSRIWQPTLVVSAKDSPEAFRRCNDGIVAAIPGANHVLIDGGHLIDPAHPVVLDFVERVLRPARL